MRLSHRLLIGAPEAQTAQPGVEKGGAVFRCGTAREDDCEEIPFDTRGKFSHAPTSMRLRLPYHTFFISYVLMHKYS